MKTSSKLALSAVALASAAFAQTSFADEGVAYNVGVASQYRYRGIAQTRGMPALQGGVDYDSGKGFYVGAWGSTIRWIKETGLDPAYASPTGKDVKGPVELDLYGGYKFEAAGLGWDLGLLRYQYLGNTLQNAVGFTNANTTEAYLAATYGVTTLKYSNSTTDLFGNIDSKGSRYWDLSATFDLGDGYSFVPHYGRQTIKNYINSSYSDVSLTLNKDMGRGMTGSVSAIATNGKEAAWTYNGYNLAKSAVVVGLKYTF